MLKTDELFDSSYNDYKSKILPADMSLVHEMMEDDLPQWLFDPVSTIPFVSLLGLIHVTDRIALTLT